MRSGDLTGKRALVVEDSALIAFMTQDMLDDLGCQEVALAGNLDEALGLARSLDLDFAILDLNLNGIDSYPVADTLAERGVPFIFASGYNASQLPQRFSHITAIGKPLVIEELADAIRLAISG